MSSQLEAIVGHNFSDRALLAGASSISERAFGALEHLGDAIADLAVALTCWRADLDAERAAYLVCNEHLDERFHALLKGHVKARSGDAVEAIVGAVFLDAGFETAAEVAVHLCAPGMAWRPLASGESVDDVPMWLGPIVIDAIVTADAVPRFGATTTSQGELSEHRKALVNNAALEQAVERSLVAEGIEAGDPIRWFRRESTRMLVQSGWEPTARFVLSVVQP
jgi:dsRNA-specific ribonuclease